VRTSTSTVTTLRNALAARRADWRERQQLERELASYSTRADRLELELMIDRHRSEDTYKVRDILDRQAAARRHVSTLALYRSV
jgi:hypothetical protein